MSLPLLNNSCAVNENEGWRLEITQPEMTKRFPLLHRLNIHIAVSNKLGLGAWSNGIWNSMARNTNTGVVSVATRNHGTRPDQTGKQGNAETGPLVVILGLPIHQNYSFSKLCATLVLASSLSGIFALVRQRLMAQDMDQAKWVCLKSIEIPSHVPTSHLPGSTTIPSSSPMNPQFSTPPPSATRDRRGRPLDELPYLGRRQRHSSSSCHHDIHLFFRQGGRCQRFLSDLACWC